MNKKMRFRLKRGAALAVASALSSFVASPALAEWLRAETDHFIVYGDTSEGSLRRYAQKVERFDALLRTYYPIPTDHEIPKLEIYMAEGRRDMNRMSPGISEGVAGYYSPNSGRIYTIVDTRSSMGDVVVFHEYAHHFMFQMQANAYPSWFVEGFAEYYSTATLTNDRIQFGRHNPGRMNSLTSGFNSWAKMEDVLKWRIPDSGRFPAHLYYAQSWAMTHYFMSTPDRTQMLGRYLSAVARGEDSIIAMQAATGRTPAQLQDDIWRYISGSINIMSPQIAIIHPEVAISKLSKAEADAIWLDVRLDNAPIKLPAEEEAEGDTQTDAQKARRARARRQAAENRAELIRSAFALGERHADSDMGRLLAARAHRLSQRPDLALAALAPSLDANTNNAQVLRVAALALLDQTDTAESIDDANDLRRQAAAYLARAMHAEPLDFRIYLGLNDVRNGQPRYPTDNDISTLEVACALAPQSFDCRTRLAHAYMARDMNPEAIAVLTPVANSPHSSGYKRQARAMINRARQALHQAPLETGPEPDDEDDADAPGQAADAA
ncbi:DUF1570 domain-containing protein [Brevundimonas naejangsanensis]|uniref:DUF1570 domain-containing protein n=1 Tax=Brevundimonas naejangsanensis TaxID=588932 RepID=UPI003208F7EE